MPAREAHHTSRSRSLYWLASYRSLKNVRLTFPGSVESCGLSLGPENFLSVTPVVIPLGFLIVLFPDRFCGNDFQSIAELWITLGQYSFLSSRADSKPSGWQCVKILTILREAYDRHSAGHGLKCFCKGANVVKNSHRRSSFGMVVDARLILLLGNAGCALYI